MVPMESGSSDNKFTTMYNFIDIGESTQTITYSKPKRSIRPKSAELMKQTKTTVDEVVMKKSVSLSNIEEFFLKRRIPLIKPLVSEREIMKLQLLQEQCRKKGIESEKKSSQKYLENIDLSYTEFEEESKDKKRDVASPLVNGKVKSGEGDTRQRDKKQDESEESRKARISVSGKSRDEAKKVIKDRTFNKLKSSPQKGEKIKNKQGVSDKGKAKIEKDENKLVKKQAKTSSKSEMKTTKNDAKMTNETKLSKNKEKYTNSEESLSGENMKHIPSNKDSVKGAKKQTSKDKIKSEMGDKGSLSKVVSGHSKDDTSRSKKSDKSNKTGSNTSNKIVDSSNEIKKKDKDDNSVKDPNEKNKLSKIKTQSEGLKKGEEDGIEDGSEKTDWTKGANKTKPGTTDPLAKEKQVKISAAKKSVKFPNLIQHIIHYILSNPMFIKLGWTLSPDRAQLQVVTFKAVPATPHTYCFRERVEDEVKYYSKSLEKLAYYFKKNGVGTLFYPSGAPAANISNHKAGMRLTLYSDPKNDPLIRDSYNRKVLGIFDSSGNGVVYDMQGTKVLNFNQLEGILWSPQRKSPYKWQWCDYKVLEKQQSKALLRYMAKEQKQPVPIKKEIAVRKAKSDEKKLEVDEAYENILAELPYPIVQKTKTKSERQFWGFKPITLKINSEMTLRINGQDNVIVNFSSSNVFFRIDLGVKIDSDVVERIEQLAPSSVAVSEVPCVFDDLLDLSPSIQHVTPASAQYST